RGLVHQPFRALNTPGRRDRGRHRTGVLHEQWAQMSCRHLSGGSAENGLSVNWAFIAPMLRSVPPDTEHSQRSGLDHLVGLKEERRRNLQPKRRRDPEVDPHLELRGLLNRDVSGFAPLRILSTKMAARPNMSGL